MPKTDLDAEQVRTGEVDEDGGSPVGLVFGITSGREDSRFAVRGMRVDHAREEIRRRDG
jgi:hypothetical protein